MFNWHSLSKSQPTQTAQFSWRRPLFCLLKAPEVIFHPLVTLFESLVPLKNKRDTLAFQVLVMEFPTNRARFIRSLVFIAEQPEKEKI